MRQYKSQADFARFIEGKYPGEISKSTVERLSKKWREKLSQR
jgi:hypothetical protein